MFLIKFANKALLVIFLVFGFLSFYNVIHKCYELRWDVFGWHDLEITVASILMWGSAIYLYGLVSDKLKETEGLIKK